jgi:hypothetical protein
MLVWAYAVTQFSLDVPTVVYADIVLRRTAYGQLKVGAMTEDPDETSNDSVGVILSQSINHVGFERVVLARYERLYPSEFPHPARANDDIDRKLNSTAEHLGGPRAFYLAKDGSKPPLADSYPDAALREVMSVFA